MPQLSHYLSLEPPQLQFLDVQRHTRYIQAFVIRNLTCKAVRVRFLPPKSSVFRLAPHVKPADAVAPGLPLQVEVEYLFSGALTDRAGGAGGTKGQARRKDAEGAEGHRLGEEDIDDVLVVVTEFGRVDVPLCARSPCAVISYPTRLDFGKILVGCHSTKEVLLHNAGSIGGTFSLSCDDLKTPGLQVAFAPPSATIEARKSLKVRVEIMAQKDEQRRATGGAFEERVKVRLTGVSALDGRPPAIELRGVSVTERLHCLVGTEETDAVDMGRLYFGQSRKKTISLLNDGPFPAHFRAQPQPSISQDDLNPSPTPLDNEDPLDALIRSAVSSSPSTSLVSISPCSGTVPAYGELQISVTLTTPPYVPQKGFFTGQQMEAIEAMQKPIDVKCIVECEELMQTTSLNVRAVASVPGLGVGPADRLVFGGCPVGERRDRGMTLTNRHAHLPLTFKIDKVTSIFSSVTHGTLGPLESLPLVVTFLPNHTGPHVKPLTIRYADTLYSMHLEVEAEGLPSPLFAAKPKLLPKTTTKGGLDKTADDLAPQYQYVREEDAVQMKRQKGGPPTMTRLMKKEHWAEEDNKALDSLLQTMQMSQSTITVDANPFALGTQQLRDKIVNRQKYTRAMRHGGQAYRRQQREAATIKKQLEQAENDVLKLSEVADLGLTPGSGLKAPVPKASEVPREPLWLKRPMDEGLEARGVTGKRYVHNENKLFKKKFKAHPSTQAEVRDCAAELEAWQLQLISIGPKNLDFGEIYVKSHSTKCLSVFNDLPSSVLVAITVTNGTDTNTKNGGTELKRSTPLSQVVPSAQAAGFDIVICSDQPGPVHRQCVATINGKYPVKFSVSGQVIPVRLKLSREELNFRFAEDSLEATLTETIILANHGNATARFRWLEPDDTTNALGGQFRVVPSEGQVKAGGGQSCSVTFTPPPHGDTVEAFLTLKIEDGEDVKLHCTGVTPEGTVHFVTKRMDLGSVAVGQRIEQSAVISNPGSTNAIVFVEDVPDAMSVAPTRTRLPSGGTTELQVTALLADPREVNGVLQVRPRGGKPARLPIVLTALVPEVSAAEPEVNFETITLGGFASRPLTLHNESPVDCVLYVDLSDKPEFSLAVAEAMLEGQEADKGDRSNGEGDGGKKEGDRSGKRITARMMENMLQKITKSQYEEAMQPPKPPAMELLRLSPDQQQQQALDRRSSTKMVEIADVDEDEDEEERLSHIWKVTVPQRSTLMLEVQYQPTEIKAHTFSLPVRFVGGTVPPELRREIKAEAVSPRLLLSATLLDFETKVVTTSVVSAPTVASVLELDLTNTDKRAVNWAVDVEALKKYPGVFQMEPSERSIQVDQTVTVRAGFTPKEPIHYQLALPIFISPPQGEEESAAESSSQPAPVDRSRAYLEIRLKGSGVVPTLYFDRREVVLPTVPLNIKSRQVFFVNNEGYDLIELKVRLPSDTVRIPITVEFPEGQMMGLAKSRIPVEVSLLSPKPISFTCRLEFLDGEGVSYSMPVSGTCDNCLLTLYDYLNLNPDFYEIDDTRDPPTLAETEDAEDRMGSEAAPSQRSERSQSAVGSSAGWVIDLSADFLVRWLNGTVLKSVIETYPQDLIASQGRQLHEIVEILTGKKIGPLKQKGPTVTTGGPATSAPEKSGKEVSGSTAGPKVLKTVAAYEDILNYLKQNGALLSHVRPEYLLTMENFIKYMQGLPCKPIRTHSGRLVSHMSRRPLERQFMKRAPEAWTNTVLQTVKIFLLNRLTPRVFLSMAGVSSTSSSETGEADPSSPHFDTSNISDSNLYSPAEALLLRWLSYHYKRVDRGQNPRPITQPSRDLRDSLVLANVVMSHIPESGPLLQNLKKPCTAPEHYEQNAQRLIAVLQEMGLHLDLKPQDIAEGNSRDLLLYLLWLVQQLPHYIPKSTIHFATPLGLSATKHLELTNPTKKRLEYRGRIHGSSDFSLPSDTVTLEPRGTALFPIDFKARFLKPVDARLTFLTKKESPGQAAALVFRLKSQITSKRPNKTVNITTKLYNLHVLVLEVANTLGVDGDFKMTVSTEKVDPVSKKGLKSTLAYPDKVNPFYVATSRLRIRKDGTITLQVHFMPIEMGHHLCTIAFRDANAGEFYYEVLGEATLPAPMEERPFPVSAKCQEPTTFTLPIHSANPKLDRVRQILIDRVHQETGRTPSVLLNRPDKAVTYEVTSSSPFMKVPKTLSVMTGGTRINLDSADGGGSAKLPIEFAPKEAGMYPATITLTSAYDVRVYAIEGTATAPNTHCTLTFNTTARKSITQELPFVNPTDTDWFLRATFAPQKKADGSALQAPVFDGPSSLVAKKKIGEQKTTTVYPLTFNPDWVCEVHGHLDIYNTSTNETYEYDLIGTADEPLAEDHVVVQCQAREKTDVSIEVTNPTSSPLTYDVESDLLNISGPPSFSLPAFGKGAYPLSVLPILSGSTTGSVVFKQQDSERYQWYTLQINASPPKPQATLKLQCVVREAVCVSLQMTNPLDDIVTLEVSLIGDGLLGESEFVLAPREAATYQLIYAPLVPGQYRGSASLLSEKLGEFWYDLELTADPAPPTEIPLMECEVGTTKQHTVTIENPLGYDVALIPRSSNPSNFRVSTPRLLLPPFDTADITLEYSPTTIDHVEEGTITLDHPLAGEWVYNLTGKGLLPRRPKEVSVVTTVGRAVSSTVHFKNPFMKALSVMVFLVVEAKPKGSGKDSTREQQASGAQDFTLLLKKTRLHVAPLASVPIPFVFSPASMREHVAEIVVRADDPAQQGLQWIFRLKGLVEAPIDPQLHPFSTRARQPLDTEYSFSLVGVQPSREPLEYELEVPPDVKEMVDRTFALDFKDTLITEADQSAVMLVKFAPMRPFTANCTLIIKRSSGGRWRFQLRLYASVPDPDDTISIESPINQQTAVAFRLTNIAPTYSQFEAFFAPESPSDDFIVTPTSGTLDPAGSSGTMFIVSYRPTEYGKTVTAKLVIQTEDTYWSYLVRGTHPHYNAPEITSSRLDNKLDPAVAKELRKAENKGRATNFIRANMKKAAAAADFRRDR
ncbi:unnamed protein product [Vitrella brassicaformis CCMP3155]|uniref:Calponin-homology (CH) domain-containing protein n=1 Tax=Vitrella brassicaformis (strain CCMP3155) TaxID=1169540 RepID=A0A0G4F3L5_VITBC|nr:unnamed protein product [Vitrella brassicaformis CCMP3155]|eukprot:CEM06420.1 unnamed protein product [Vitrella brassicaformis CCMP3155]